MDFFFSSKDCSITFNENLCLQRQNFLLSCCVASVLMSAFNTLTSALIPPIRERMHTTLSYYSQPVLDCQTVGIHTIHNNLQTIRCLRLAPLSHSVTVPEITRGVFRYYVARKTRQRL